MLDSRLPKDKKIDKPNIIFEPIQIPLPQKIKKIVAGPLHSYAITENIVYFWGKKHAYSNEVSLDAFSEVAQSSKMIEFPIKVDNLATGSNHTFAWNKKEVYCWGSNQFYELGLSEEKNYGCQNVQLFQQAMKNGYQLKQISCGKGHSFAVFKIDDEQDEQLFENEEEVIIRHQNEQENQGLQIFAWGKSQSHQLTINSQLIIPYPVLAPCSFKHLQSLRSKSDYNLALCNGKVYSWGANIFSRLGHSQSKVRIPQLVPLPVIICSIGIGNHHAVAVSIDGCAFAWGKGDVGQLGLDRFEAQSKPCKMICEEKIIAAACGDLHTLVLLQNKSLKSCGGNKYGILGHNQFDSSHKLKRCKSLEPILNDSLGQIVMIQCGNHHNIVLNIEGKAFGWGNNDHYQIIPLSHPNKISHQNSRWNKKSLQIIIDDEDNCRKAEDQPMTAQIFLQKLQDWEKRYSLFKQAKQRQQQAFLKQHAELIKNFKQKKG